jgi:hypothetical protein
LIKHWESIKQLKFNEYDLLLFNEIWQIRDYENINIDGFKIAAIEQRENRKGGGVIIYVRKTISFIKIDSINIAGIIETAAIKINDAVIISLYRPPSGSKNEFIEQLNGWIDNLESRKVYVAGDFNINYLNEDKQLYERIEHETGLKAKITSVTRYISNTCIDNAVTNIDGTHKVSNICIADHQGIISSIKLAKTKKEVKKHTYREMSERNWSTFSAGINNLSLRGLETEEKWNNLCNDIKLVVEQSFPEKQKNTLYKFSMSQGLLKSKAKKKQTISQI